MRFPLLYFFLLLIGAVLPAAQEPPKSGSVEILVSVADQKMVLVRDGEPFRTYSISTSRFGLGDNYGTYRTPLGRLKIIEKIGGGLPLGAVIKRRQATGEVLAANAPGRDPIVTRILWLEGLEGQNRNAYGRCIYIHGTPDEKRLGRPVSFGCIRMRSSDVVELYAMAPVGTTVSVTKERLPYGGPSGLLDLFVASVSGKKISGVKL